MATDAPKGPAGHRWHAGRGALVALLLAAAGEGVVTLIQTLAHGAHLGDAIAGFLVTVGLLLPVAVAGAALAWLLFGGRRVASVWPAIAGAFAGTPAAGSIAVLVVAGALGWRSARGSGSACASSRT